MSNLQLIIKSPDRYSDLLFVVCTQAKTQEEFEKRPVYESLQRHYDHYHNTDFVIFKDNTKGLPECYNSILKNPININKTVLFVHDDVVLEDMFLVDKLLASPYSITGLAGAKSFNTGVEKAAWHLAAPREDYVGEVAHTQNGFVWTTIFGKAKSRTLVLDGLFLACKVKDLVDNEVFFEESFSFHHYDISFCLNADKKKVSCGVLPIRVVHHGLGDSMNTPEWEESNKKFKEMYCK